MLLKAVFWDLDGTLIDSEPLWHDGEIEIAHNNGGEWNEDLGWECSGTPVPHVAEVMIAHGCTLSVPEIDKQLKDYVFKAEVERLPWIPGVQDVLHSLKEADIPSMLVTTSPRHGREHHEAGCWIACRLRLWRRSVRTQAEPCALSGRSRQAWHRP